MRRSTKVSELGCLATRASKRPFCLGAKFMRLATLGKARNEALGKAYSDVMRVRL